MSIKPTVQEVIYHLLGCADNFGKEEILEVINSMTDEEREKLYYLIGKFIE